MRRIPEHVVRKHCFDVRANQVRLKPELTTYLFIVETSDKKVALVFPNVSIIRDLITCYKTLARKATGYSDQSTLLYFQPDRCLHARAGSALSDLYGGTGVGARQCYFDPVEILKGICDGDFNLSVNCQTTTCPV